LAFGGDGGDFSFHGERRIVGIGTNSIRSCTK
jgi:hypothetical protein